MFTTSERWKRAVRYGGRVVSYVDVVDDAGQYVVSNLPVVGGSVSVDRTRKTRRECSLSIQDPTGRLVPNEVDDLLQPYSGHYLKLYRGFRYRDNTEEVIPLGTFAPWDPKVSETSDSLAISVQGYDRSKIISQLRWTEPYVITAGTNTAIAVRDMLLSRMSNLSMSLRPTNTTTPLTTFGLSADQNNPWDDAVKLANADGMELYFDSQDVLRMEPAAPELVDESPTPSMIYQEGPTCTVSKIDRANSADQQYTGVVVRGGDPTTTTPIYVEVWRSGTKLRIPYFISSTLITTYEQAVSAALARLRLSGRAQIAVSLSAVPDPSQEVDDVIRVVSTRSRLDDVYQVSAISMPLDAESSMSIATSERRLR